ncbi:hypothetical protein KSS87_013084 [Heliosperma pusillum]|nr:hypothetical protein KSS87_013084 [Heliosperma pusillum]
MPVNHKNNLLDQIKLPRKFCEKTEEIRGCQYAVNVFFFNSVYRENG